MSATPEAAVWRVHGAMLEKHMVRIFEAAKLHERWEGRKEGQEEKAKDIAVRLIETNRMTPEEISSITGLSIDEIKELSVASAQFEAEDCECTSP